MQNATILLVEGNPDDEALTLRAFTKKNIGKKMFVARGGIEAPDFLFCAGTMIASGNGA